MEQRDYPLYEIAIQMVRDLMHHLPDASKYEHCYDL